MATNEFLQFATGAGSASQLETQANYLADLVRQSGEVPGLANPLRYNKAMRQATFVTSVLCQLIIDKLGLDALDNADTAGFEAKLALLFGALSTITGQCLLTYTDITHIALVPYNGNGVQRNGVVERLPAAGLSLNAANCYIGGVAGQAAVPATTYLVYYTIIGGVQVLDMWAGGSHMKDTTAGNLGVEVRNNGGAPDPTRTLVGMVTYDGSSHFNDSTTNRGVASWYNRKRRSLTTAPFSASTASATPVEASSGQRLSWLTWADETVEFFASGYGSNTGAGGLSNLNIGIDGVTAASGFAVQAQSYLANAVVGCHCEIDTFVAEGNHYTTCTINVGGGGGTTTITMGMVGDVRV